MGRLRCAALPEVNRWHASGRAGVQGKGRGASGRVLESINSALRQMRVLGRKGMCDHDRWQMIPIRQ